MDQELQQHLQSLTAEFYKTNAASFSRSRQTSWDSWPRVLEVLPDAEPLRVLDLGCGNGRFGSFLFENVHQTIAYRGIDSEASFIETARALLPQGTFAVTSLTETLEQAETYDVIVAMGVLHHLPGTEFRARIMGAIGERLNPNGIAFISFWQPETLEAFENKTFASDLALENGDHLLGWQGEFTALRYCHNFAASEIDELIVATALHSLAVFTGEGNDASNVYAILQKQ